MLQIDRRHVLERWVDLNLVKTGVHGLSGMVKAKGERGSLNRIKGKRGMKAISLMRMVSVSNDGAIGMDLFGLESFLRSIFRGAGAQASDPSPGAFTWRDVRGCVGDEDFVVGSNDDILSCAFDETDPVDGLRGLEIERDGRGLSVVVLREIRECVKIAVDDSPGKVFVTKARVGPDVDVLDKEGRSATRASEHGTEVEEVGSRIPPGTEKELIPVQGLADFSRNGRDYRLQASTVLPAPLVVMIDICAVGPSEWPGDDEERISDERARMHAWVMKHQRVGEGALFTPLSIGSLIEMDVIESVALKVLEVADGDSVAVCAEKGAVVKARFLLAQLLDVLKGMVEILTLIHVYVGAVPDGENLF